MIELSPLDNPIWSALTSAHRGLALSNGLAARYPGEVTTLVALGEHTPAGFVDLRALVGGDETVALFTDGPLDIPDDWTVLRSRLIDQMTCAEPTRQATASSRGLVALGEEDVPDMLALTALTEPGPFSSQTIRMGDYYGVRSQDGRLAAMAGQRLGADSFVEISAVCTHPDFRGKGFAGSLIARLVDEIRADDKLPILHVKTENGAKVLYDKLGFRVRRAVQLTVIRRNVSIPDRRSLQNKGAPMPPTLANGKICYIEIPTTDVARSAAFYRNSFGWSIRQRGDGRTAFDDAIGEVSGAWILGRPPSTEAGLLIYIMVDSVVATLERIVANGGEVVQPVGADAPEITARFKDPAGNVLGLYQEPA